MKRILLSIIILAATVATVSAQSDKKARLRLKNGTRIQGVLVEEKENGSIVIEQRDGLQYEYADDEVVSLKLLDDKQHYRRKGYFGISAGANLPVGDYNSWRGGGASVGGSLNLNFGFLFHKYIGIAGAIYGKANPLDNDRYDNWYDNDTWSYGGIAVGPLFSFPAAQWLDIDLRPMIALNVTSYPGADWYDDNSTSPAFMGGVLLRFHASRRVSFVIDADYFYTNTNFDLARAGEQHISSFSIGAGVAISFK